MQVETFQAGRGRGQGRVAVGPLTGPPRLAERHSDLGADEAHVALKVPQHDLVQGQALTPQPAQVIDQQVGVGPLRARAIMHKQESISL